MHKVGGRRVLVMLGLVAGLPLVATSALAQGPTCLGEQATIVALAGEATVGTDGDDVIVGTNGNDDIRGGAGNDLICGLAGDDVIRGAKGRDQIDAGSGDDRVFGGTAGDTIWGRKGNDTISGGKGNDTIYGGSGSDTISGKGGSDDLFGGPGRDLIEGGSSDDTLRGRSGADTLNGGRGDDDLRGGSGRDLLDGGAGDNVLDGGRGRDTCLNGQGAPDDVSCLKGLKLTFVGQVDNRAGLVVSPPGDDRLFVIEQYRGIWIYKDGDFLETPFLDLQNKVSKGNEQGVLALAFHPDYSENGRLFVSYTDRSGDTKVVEYRPRTSDPDRAATSSARLVIEIAQPQRWHNGGMMQFGPDGYLYIGAGDGGPGADPNSEAQNTDTLLGGILRIDVDGAEPYEVPPDNPFVGDDGADELWAYGLRNPWRFSIDAETKRIYIADVGQSAREEINVAPARKAGINYGWKRLEGAACFSPRSGCNRSGTTPPALDLPHGNGRCSVIGGSVYRGDAIPELVGQYFWSDFCTRELSTALFNGDSVTFRETWLTVPDAAEVQAIHHLDHGKGPGFVTSLGVDSSGEIYLSTFGGTVYKVEPVR